ncbi:MAG: fumarylacetoacetate hydrolase family protein [Actinomycetota bacterium]
MTKLANVEGRAALMVDDRLVDVARRSDGRLPSDPMEALARWDDVREWAAALDAGDGALGRADVVLGPCSPRPTQVFGIGLNYRSHAEESNMELPPSPAVFTKFPSCLAGPDADVRLPSGFVDYEAELVVVIGRGGMNIGENEALDHIAGYCAGQDISERMVQLAAKPPQFSMGKSFPAFGPIGPAVVSLDELADPNDLALSCDVSGERRQETRTSDLIFSVPELVAYLSGICELRPGDLVFTGTPAGVGMGHQPPKFLRDGDVIVTAIEGVGTLTNRCTT